MQQTATLIGIPLTQAECLVVWGHGWGQSGEAMRRAAEALAGRAAHALLDFPGFGQQPPPPFAWSTADYADAVARMIKDWRDTYPNIRRVIWCGHSFGGRVGIQLAARHPDIVDGLFLVASAGLPRHRSLWQRLRLWSKVRMFKISKRLAPLLGIDVEALRRRAGSLDWRATQGVMRDVFRQVIAEDLSPEAAAIRCPTRLLYGAEDTETPPEIGERLAKLIAGATLTVLPAQDHYSVLGTGRQITAKRLGDFITDLCVSPPSAPATLDARQSHQD